MKKPKLKIFRSKDKDAKAADNDHQDGNNSGKKSGAAEGSDKHQSHYEAVMSRLEKLYQESSFLREPDGINRVVSLPIVAPLARDEVHLSSSDKGLPVGQFHHAYAIKRICLKERHQEEDFNSAEMELEDDNSMSASARRQSAGYHTARLELATSSIEKYPGYYSLKCIGKKNFKKLSQSKDPAMFLQAVTNLFLEASFLSRIHHPHIIQLKGRQGDPTATSSFILPPTDAGASEGHRNNLLEDFFLVTDRFNETLEDRLQQWTAEQAKDSSSHSVSLACPYFATKIQYAQEIASALQYLHDRKIMVLGLTPFSIGFLAQSGRLQLCDLGTCRQVPQARRISHHHQGGKEDENLRLDDDEIGDGERFVPAATTKSDSSNSNNNNDPLMVPMVESGCVPRYLAPEIVTQGQVSIHADIYSWAIIVFEILTLQKPYSNYRPGNFLVKVCLEGKRPNLSLYKDMPNILEGILRRCWRQTVEKRWSSAQICNALQSIRQELGVSIPMNTDNAVTGEDLSKELTLNNASEPRDVPPAKTTSKRVGGSAPKHNKKSNAKDQPRKPRRGKRPPKAALTLQQGSQSMRELTAFFVPATPSLRKSMSASNLFAMVEKDSSESRAKSSAITRLDISLPTAGAEAASNDKATVPANEGPTLHPVETAETTCEHRAKNDAEENQQNGENTLVSAQNESERKEHKSSLNVESGVDASNCNNNRTAPSKSSSKREHKGHKTRRRREDKSNMDHSAASADVAESKGEEQKKRRSRRIEPQADQPALTLDSFELGSSAVSGSPNAEGVRKKHRRRKRDSGEPSRATPSRSLQKSFSSPSLVASPAVGDDIIKRRRPRRTRSGDSHSSENPESRHARSVSKDKLSRRTAGTSKERHTRTSSPARNLAPQEPHAGKDNPGNASDDGGTANDNAKRSSAPRERASLSKGGSFLRLGMKLPQEKPPRPTLVKSTEDDNVKDGGNKRNLLAKASKQVSERNIFFLMSPAARKQGVKKMMTRRAASTRNFGL